MGGQSPSIPQSASSPISEYVKDFGAMTTIRSLGRGAFGSVSLVEDPTTHDKIALKSFAQQRELSQDAEESFIGEIESLIQLQHPCIVPIVGYSLPTPTSPAKVATKYASRGSLRDALESRASFLDDTMKAKIICGIVLGMRFAHSNGFMHRDLKPSNILLDEENCVLIGDFGTNRENLNVTLTGQAGTLLYMAPEVYEVDARNCTQMIDVYSFALILYEIMIGEPVFPPTLCGQVLMDQVINEVRPSLPSSMNGTIKEIITKCWSRDPTNRLSFAMIFVKLKAIDFLITPDVDSAAVRAFASRVSPGDFAPWALHCLSPVAHRRILAELRRMQSNDDREFIVDPVDDCLATIRATFSGPAGTPYEGGTFSLRLTIPPEYPFHAPDVSFETKVCHPQFRDGYHLCPYCKGCELRAKWRPGVGLGWVVLFIIDVLRTPTWRGGISCGNPEMTRAYRRSPAQFEAMAREWTRQYAGG